MRLLDAHFHWRPREIFERLCDRPDYPRVERDGKGGYRYWRRAGMCTSFTWAEWYDLDGQFAHLDALGRGQIDVVTSIGPFSAHFSELPLEEGRDAATEWN